MSRRSRSSEESRPAWSPTTSRPGWTSRTCMTRRSTDASQGTVGSAAAGQGEPVMGIPPDPRRARGARHHCGAVHGVADPQGCWHQPGSAQGRPGLVGVPAVPGAGILALDFFTADLLNGTKVYVLAVIEHGTRRIRILGATEHPVQARVVQQARNLLMDLADAGTRVKFIIHDRDTSFTSAFDEVFRAAGTRIVRSAIQAPRMSSVIERWIGSCRRELLDRTLVWNQRHLMTVLREYEDFYNTHRPHRALNQAAPLRRLPDDLTDLDHLRLRRRDRAGGVIHEYRLVA